LGGDLDGLLDGLIGGDFDGLSDTLGGAECDAVFVVLGGGDLVGVGELEREGSGEQVPGGITHT